MILTVIDWFLKKVHFVLLPKLFSAKKTAELMIEHVFRLHSLPSNIVSGQTERLNQELDTGLRLLCSKKPASWSRNMVWVE